MSGRFKGSETIETSKANHEVIPLTPSIWTDERYTFKQFSFINKMPCIVKINGSDAIFLDTEQGFDYNKGGIKSFIIVTPNVQYTYLGEY